MAVTIRDITVILTAPEGINLTVVKVETSEPELYGLGCTQGQRIKKKINLVRMGK